MRSAHFSNKTYVCCVCGEERNGNIDTSKKAICWWCVHMLMNMPGEEKLKLYRKYEKRRDIQKMIESFMKEVKNGDERTLVGRRLNKEIRFANRENRQVENVKQVDKRRAQAY